MGRGFTSSLAKAIVTFMTNIDYSQVSSFRIVRAQIARSAASSMDRYQYLDVNLLSLTSHKRQLAHRFRFVDNRLRGDSGYTLITLFKHFSRLFFSSNISGTKSFFIGLLPLVISLLLFSTLFLVRALVSGIYSLSPGWASLFSLQLIVITMLAFMAAYLVKMLGTISTRTAGIPPFMIVDRSGDRALYERLKHRHISKDV